ncbi:zinc finger protein 839 isoform X2 [Thunnus thynnus]|uniref:zinc finger protein 839 isoform X2 n=1 Tax=Thunnus thynnus TaxID=8237 RepID=UPI00352944FF
MADNEEDSGPSRTITVAEPPGAAARSPAAPCSQPGNSVPSAPAAPCSQPGDSLPSAAAAAQCSQSGDSLPSASATQCTQPGESLQSVPGAQCSQPGDSLPAGSGAQLADFLQSCPGEQSILLGTEFTGLSPDLVNTTIIYVQPDGSLLESSGLTAEEQQALLDQLTKQQIVQVSDTEAAQLLQQSQVVKTIPVHNAALDPSQLQQVINQVTKSQQQVQPPQQQVHIQVPQQSLKTSSQNNASQQLKTAAQQVAMQTSGSVQVVQKKSEPVRIQIQIPPKQEVKPGSAPQQKSLSVNQPQVKLSTNGSLNSAQIIHIQPVVGQQGQQFFLQQSPGDPHIQLLLQSPAPVVGSLLPLVHKLTGQTTSASAASAVGQKPASSPIRVQSPSAIKTPPTSTVKSPPPSSIKTVSFPLIKTPTNGMTVAASKGPIKPAATITAVPAQNTTTAAARPPTGAPPPVAPPPAGRDKEKEKERGKKLKKREKKAVKVQTRSGRVSRPPKYKAKDYKFIKTEDLADSHQSDSDDYSDMSVEEEEGEGGRKDGSAPGTSPSLTYSHKSRSHCCQTCDKAYIGPGGLNRHYKLNPTHGEPDPPGNTPHPLRDDSQSQEPTAAASAGVKDEEEEKKKEDKPVATATNRVTVGLVSRRGRRGRPPKLSVTMATAEQQAERRRERLQELVEQCEDEELMDIVLPRLTKVLSLWELLLAKVERGGPARTRFPDIYREFESLQAQVRQAAQDYIISPQGGATPLEVRNIEVARSLGILDEVNRMKVVPGVSHSTSLTNKNVRYMENSKMLPPSKRFKMENSVPVQQNGIELHRTVTSVPPVTSVTSATPMTSTIPVTSVTSVTSITPVTSVSSTLKSCSVSVSPLVIPSGSKLLSTTADPAPRSSGPTCATTSPQALPPATPMEVTPGENQGAGPLQTDTQVDSLPAGQDQVLSTSDIAAQMKELEKALGPRLESRSTLTPESRSTLTPESRSTLTPESGSQILASPQHQSESSTKELQEGQEIYIQTEGLTVQLAEPGSDRIVIVNGPDGTTMHIQTPEGVPLEAVQALLGIEASDGANKILSRIQTDPN